MKQVQVTLRLPISTMQHIKRVAKLAGVTPTQVYKVIMALTVAARPDAAPETDYT